ncbi:GAF sensor signal transduction histidine kinase [Lishizhenia tianjinensis]|uniref:histidine kinase n=1 Tax=Lishizhenia tianjinensis TaxID=477690 RepID=A0A1I6XYM2_9FLAO|nr:GAF domain-containing sensor histidine kinase [Lishizhenia tianjinensis]SFT42924.1 GAF sensor signal transduction histidine kinase [Lishizhenia tianjinensis]
MHYKLNEAEKKRIKELESYSILDTLPEADYDAITKIAAQICDTEISLVSLVDADRQWFKSHLGIDATETPREYSFCSRAIVSQKDIYIIDNAKEHPTYKDNPLVTGPPHIMFYAGVPLEGNDGYKLGSLCVIDSEKKQLSEAQIEALIALGKQVENLLKLRKNQMVLDEIIRELELKNESLEQFAYVAAHDIKSPLNNIRALVDLILKKDVDDLSEGVLTKLRMIQNTSDKLKRLVDALLEYSQVDAKMNEVKEVNVQEVMDTIVDLHSSDSVNIKVSTDREIVYFSELSFYQILHNLVVNAIKYNDKDHVKIEINLSSNEEECTLTVKDNGVGIAPENYKKVFETFTTLKTKDKYGNYGSGLGLSILKKIVEQYRGEISVTSTLGEGSCFTVVIPKIKDIK